MRTSRMPKERRRGESWEDIDIANLRKNRLRD